METPTYPLKRRQNNDEFITKVIFRNLFILNYRESKYGCVKKKN